MTCCAHSVTPKLCGRNAEKTMTSHPLRRAHNGPYTSSHPLQPAVMLPPIVFSHANSYPASTYRVLFERWRAAGHEVHAIERLGHDPRYPVTTDWPHLVEQLRDFTEREVGQPAYLVGHSLGGYLSMMVASRHPHLAAGVVVMDSPLLTGWKSAGLGMAKRFKAMDRVMPSRVSAQRTHEWPNLQAAQAHFRTKPLFAAFHPDVLADYVAHGTVTHADGASRRLSFDRDIESAIYRTVPHRLLHNFRRRPSGAHRLHRRHPLARTATGGHGRYPTTCGVKHQLDRRLAPVSFRTPPDHCPRSTSVA